MSQGEEPPEEDTLNILIATDTHLGYGEKDPVRQNDSLQTFEEILQYARRFDVDMILLGGDLFHDNKPSRKIMHGCMQLLREYCMGDRPCQFQILSDQSENFPNRFSRVNYEDPNFNVSYPVFSIHGNHDDPAGDGYLSSLDLLSASNLVNYFGMTKNVDDIKISPILIQKGATKLALYGLGSVRDERLYRTFLNKKVKMLRPESSEDKEWFNMFVIHQNRVKHSATNYIPEKFLPEFLDLVIWGHEHKCEVKPQLMAAQDTYISQPGSSIATSLSEGEAEPKHIGILKIYKETFLMEKLPLRTVRPFYIDEVCLEDEDLDPTKPQTVETFLKQKVQEMIDDANRDYEERKKDEPELQKMLPLIRLKVEYTGFDLPNVQRLIGQKFVNKVANPKEILNFYKRRVAHKPSENKKADVDTAPTHSHGQNTARVEDLVKNILKEQKLDVLNKTRLGKAVKQYVEKDEKTSIKEFVEWQIKHTTESLIKRKETDADANIQMDTNSSGEEDRVNLSSPVSSSPAKGKGRAGSKPASKRRRQQFSDDDDDDDSFGEGDAEPQPKKRATKKAATKKTPVTVSKSKRTTSSRAAKQKAEPIVIDDSDDIEEIDSDEYVPPAKTTTSKKPAPRKTRRLPKGL
eukprot:m.76395 g.76395  ORF g.76395 m.76395 type:complete len:633 (+) comp12554_c0_seq1:227-2125(+)